MPILTRLRQDQSVYMNVRNRITVLYSQMSISGHMGFNKQEPNQSRSKEL